MSHKILVREPWTALQVVNPKNGPTNGREIGALPSRTGVRTDEGLTPLVDRLCDLFPGAGVSLLEIDEGGRSYVAWHTHTIGNCDAVEANVFEHLSLKVDRRARLCRLPAGNGTGTASVQRQYNCSLIIRLQSEIDGLAYVIVASLDRPDRRIRPEEELLFADHAGELIELLEGIKSGVAYELKSSFGCTVTANAPWGVLAIGATGRVLFANMRAEQILSRQAGLQVRHGRLQFERAAVARTFVQILDGLSNWNGMEASDPTPPSRAVSVPGPGGEICYALWLTPVLARWDRPGDVAVVVYLTDLLERATAQRPLLATIFSLTAKEAHLAELFGSGHNLEQAASMMGIARNTARIHLSNIFAKTATHSQVELARLLARLPSSAPVSDHPVIQGQVRMEMSALSQ